MKNASFFAKLQNTFNAGKVIFFHCGLEVLICQLLSLT